MNRPSGKLINIIATGIIVLVLFSLALFWGRLFCNFALMKNIPEHFLRIIIRPSGLVPGEPYPQQMKSSEGYWAPPSAPPGPNEPNFQYSQINAWLSREGLLTNAIGILSFMNIWPWSEPRSYPDVNQRVYYRFDDKDNFICFDKTSGLIVERYVKQEGLNKEHKQIELFAGPNGVSRTSDLSLGRFYAPIAPRSWWLSDYNRLGFYDKVERRFYIVDFDKGSVSKGLRLEKGDSREPIETGVIGKGSSVGWNPPMIWKAAEDINATLAEQAGGVTFGKWKPQNAILPGNSQPDKIYVYHHLFDPTYTFVPVLDKTGRIYIYNSKEQSLTQCGYVPVPPSLFNSKPQSEPANLRDVLAYQVWPVYAVLRLPSVLKEPGKIIDVKYIGMCVGSVSREGTAMAVAAFDPNGRLICRADTEGAMVNSKNMVSSDEAIYGEQGKSFWAAVEYILENLQPPVLEAASYFCAKCFEASEGHRTIFILPNSFVGMLGRGTFENFFEQMVKYFLLTGLSLILSVWLAIKVNRDAILAGLSPVAKKWWLIGTIAFGLPAYITYRLTRSKETLVSCQNCGKMRRPDMETCHRCGSKWEIPELTPPNWRISD